MEKQAYRTKMMQKKFNGLNSIRRKLLLFLKNSKYQALNLPLKIQIWLTILYPLLFWGILCALIVINAYGEGSLICNVILAAIWLASFGVENFIQVKYIPDCFDEDIPESKPHEHI